jgi:hypothetical protein
MLERLAWIIQVGPKGNHRDLCKRQCDSSTDAATAKEASSSWNRQGNNSPLDF